MDSSCLNVIYNHGTIIQTILRIIVPLYFHNIIYRSSHQRKSIKKVFLKNSSKFTGKHLCQSLFFTKVAGLTQSATLSKGGTGVFLGILPNFYEHLFPRAPPVATFVL